MGDEDNGVLVVGEDVLEYLTLGVGVKGARCLVEKHDAAGTEECPGDGYALCLTFGKATALFGKDGVEAVGEGADKVGTYGTKGSVHLFVGRSRVAKEEVLA